MRRIGRPRPLHGQDGAVAVVIAILMVVLLGAAALSFDIGRILFVIEGTVDLSQLSDQAVDSDGYSILGVTCNQ